MSRKRHFRICRARRMVSGSSLGPPVIVEQNPGRSVLLLNAFGFDKWAQMLQTFKFQRQGSFPSHTKKRSHTLVMLKFTGSQ